MDLHLMTACFLLVFIALVVVLDMGICTEYQFEMMEHFHRHQKRQLQMVSLKLVSIFWTVQ